MAEDFDKICLGDGKVAVRDDMGFAFLVDGSRLVSREPTGLWQQEREARMWDDLFTSRVNVVPQGHKWCSQCGEVRPYSYFDKDSTRRDGYSYTCKMCKNPKDAERKRRKYREQAAAEGRDVRSYSRRMV